MKVATPDVRVRARRGYVAGPAKPAGAAAGDTTVVASGVSDAVNALARLKPGAEIFVQAAVSATELTAVIELASERVARGAWPRGATIALEVTDARRQPHRRRTGKD